MIDVCNAKPVEAVEEALVAMMATLEKGISGNFQQKKYPVNPISYMNDRGISSIFRYVQTHPDMDTWTASRRSSTSLARQLLGHRQHQGDAGLELGGFSLSASDWRFYKRLRDTDPDDDPRRLTLCSGAQGQYYNRGKDGAEGGDGLYILAPTKELVAAANEADQDYNRCSYVILYHTGGRRIVFGGDSHDATWDHILEHHEDDVTDIDLLIAPHHGRKSGRSYEFLDTLTPTLTFFGNARSQHLAYGAWANRGLSIVTNNQANCMVVDTRTNPMTLYVTHENFARRVNSSTYYSDSFKAWYVGPITEDIIP